MNLADIAGGAAPREEIATAGKQLEVTVTFCLPLNGEANEVEVGRAFLGQIGTLASQIKDPKASSYEVSKPQWFLVNLSERAGKRVVGHPIDYVRPGFTPRAPRGSKKS